VRLPKRSQAQRFWRREYLECVSRCKFLFRNAIPVESRGRWRGDSSACPNGWLTVLAYADTIRLPHCEREKVEFEGRADVWGTDYQVGGFRMAVQPSTFSTRRVSSP
jgi:hypothetical protein